MDIDDADDVDVDATGGRRFTGSGGRRRRGTKADRAPDQKVGCMLRAAVCCPVVLVPDGPDALQATDLVEEDLDSSGRSWII